MNKWPTCGRCNRTILMHQVNASGGKCADGVLSPTFTAGDVMMVYEALGRKIPDTLRHAYNKEKADEQRGDNHTDDGDSSDHVGPVHDG